MRIGAILPCNTYNTSFSGEKFSLYVDRNAKQDTVDRKQAELDREAIQAQKAREKGVSVPNYRVKYTKDGEHVERIRYEADGDIIDVDDNPLKSKHYGSLFKNLYYMDRAGIFHNDLDKSHIFFKKDGSVEFDCFRYSVNFFHKYDGTIKGNDGSIRTPDFMMPSNEDTFKEHFLGEYVNNLDEDRKYNFVKSYLKHSSSYHAKRAELLLKRGFYLHNKAVEYEDVQAEALLEPSNQIINYEINKLDNYAQKRAAFTEWDEGGGAGDNEVSPQRRFNAILLYLDCLDSAVELRNEAKYLSMYARTPLEREYFKFETEFAQKRLDNLYNDTKGMGAWNFNDDKNGIYLGDRDEKQFFLDLYDEIDTSGVDTTNIKDVKEYYTDLIKEWNTDLNKRNKYELENNENC